MSPVYTYIYHPIEEKERREITFSVWDRMGNCLFLLEKKKFGRFRLSEGRRNKRGVGQGKFRG